MNIKEKTEITATSWQSVLGILPSRLREEIIHITERRKNFFSLISEIRLRADGTSAVLFVDRTIPLVIKVSEDELNDIIYKACEGSLYAYRDTLAQGYIPLIGGIRVGVCGHARYDAGNLVGVRGVRSLVLRLPFGECGFADELAELFTNTSRCGMLVYAPPAGGKTTALRSLVRALSNGANSKRVCVVDERCEFAPENYIGCSVDILRGYKRADGIELATRTLSPEIIVIDEIGSEEAKSLEGVIRCGIPIVATTHASTMDEITAKPYIKRFIEMGAFDFLVGITRASGEFGFVATGINAMKQ